MRKRIFIDTNILIYAVDRHDAKKHKIAKELIAEHARRALISTQVLQEFYVALTKKLQLSPLVAKDLVKSLGGFHCIQVNTEILFQAIDISMLNRISFWDALVVTAAASGGCTTILSEDMHDGQMISGVEIENPFKNLR